MTPEQFDALVSMIRVIIRAESEIARNSSDGGLMEAVVAGEVIDETRKLFVTEPPRELTGCQHLRGFRVEAVNGSRWSCCGEAYGP